MEITLHLPTRNSNKPRQAPSIERETSQLVSMMHGGRWYQAAREGRVFTGNAAAAGIVLPIFSNTAQKFGLWNPKGSGIDCVIARLAMTFVSTTGAAGGYVLGVVQNAPGSTGTAAEGISAFTDGTLNTDTFNGRIGSKVGPIARFTPSAATVTAPVIARHLGLNQLVLTAADATNPQWKADFEFDGDLILPPGNAIFLAGNIATLCTIAPSITWVEEPANA